MLTLDDVIGMSDLTEDEIDAIVEHEHCPEIIAAELGNYLVHSPSGVPMLRRMILEDIARAEAREDYTHALKLRLVLRHFVETHPDFEPDKHTKAPARPS
jgi:hypothetical protein